MEEDPELIRWVKSQGLKPVPPEMLKSYTAEVMARTKAPVARRRAPVYRLQWTGSSAGVWGSVAALLLVAAIGLLVLPLHRPSRFMVAQSKPQISSIQDAASIEAEWEILNEVEGNGTAPTDDADLLEELIAQDAAELPS